MWVRLPNVSHWKYLLVGLLYSALLSVYAVGLALAPRNAQFGLALACVAFVLAFGAWVAAVYFADVASVQVIVWVLIPIQVGGFGLLTAGGLFSLYGWIKFFRRKKSESTESSQ
jgi:hypothetical protein